MAVVHNRRSLDESWRRFTASGGGSNVKLDLQDTRSREWPDFVFAFHGGEELRPRMLVRIVKRTGLTPNDR